MYLYLILCSGVQLIQVIDSYELANTGCLPGNICDNSEQQLDGGMEATMQSVVVKKNAIRCYHIPSPTDVPRIEHGSGDNNFSNGNNNNNNENNNNNSGEVSQDDGSRDIHGRKKRGFADTLCDIVETTVCSEPRATRLQQILSTSLQRSRPTSYYGLISIPPGWICDEIEPAAIGNVRTEAGGTQGIRCTTAKKVVCRDPSQ